MNERKALRARLEILEDGLRTGRSTQAEVDECRLAYEALAFGAFGSAQSPNTISVQAPAPTSSVATRPFKQDGKTEQLSAEVVEMLEGIRSRKNELEAKKAMLCNSLGNYPDHVNCKDVVDEILSLREQWKAEGDKERHVLEFGKLPEDTKINLPEGWADKLPRDKYKLDRDLKNLKINLKKWNDKLAVCKDLGSIQDLKVKIIQGEIKLDVMDKLFKSL